MASTCVIVADGARARFITLQLPVDPGIDGGPRLLEQRNIVNPDADLPETERFSDRSGLAHASPKGAAHALDDHREAHGRELERRYARDLLEELYRFVRREEATRLLLIASPRLLGTMRAELDRGRLAGVELVELSEDLSRRPLDQIQSLLAAKGLVPGAATPEEGVFHPRGQAPHER